MKIEDRGTEVRIEAKPQLVELGFSFDGAERVVFAIAPERLIEIAEAAACWQKEVIINAASCKHLDCNWEGRESRENVG